MAEPLPSSTAENWALVDYLTPPGQAMVKAVELATKVAAMPPLPVRMAKRAINASAHALNDATSFMDVDQFLLTQGMDDV